MDMHQRSHPYDTYGQPQQHMSGYYPPQQPQHQHQPQLQHAHPHLQPHPHLPPPHELMHTAMPPVPMSMAHVPASMPHMPLSMPSSGPSPLHMGAPHQGLRLPPPVPAARSNGSKIRPPLTIIGTDGTHTYELVVEQQPQRARMCGFGDKDRRPITPPPCIRLIIKDKKSGQPVDFNEVDGSFFVLQVDLWNDDADCEANLVRASSGSPSTSISTAVTTSFPPTPDRPTFTGVLGPTPVPTTDGQHIYIYPTQFGVVYPTGPVYPTPGGYMPAPRPDSSMYTRNLIGNVAVNAARLTDLDHEVGWWFVLQDLSVRTEGWFRLKMNFINVAALDGSGLQRGKAPVLASVFSDKFQVYSAKKFPGVIESTALSKAFAHQGIKIPIRKDASKDEKDEDD